MSDDLRQQLEAAYGDDADTGEATATQAETPAEPATERPVEAAQPDDAAKDRADGRDEHGRFKAKEGEKDGGEAKEGSEQPAEIKAPAQWTKEEKEWFYQQPIEAQRTIARRAADMEKHFHQRNQEFSTKEQEYGAINEALAPLEQGLQSAGISKPDYVKRLVEADRRLSQDPVGAIKWLMQGYGVTPQHLSGQGNGGQRQPNPEYQALVQEIQRLKGTLGNFQQQQAAAEQQSAMSAIEAFQNATDPSGNPKHPHFEQVREFMGQLIEAGRASDLETAYDMAVHADPNIRQSIHEDTAAREAARRAQEAEQRKAKAATSVTGAPSTGVPDAAPAGSIREQLMAAFQGE